MQGRGLMNFRRSFAGFLGILGIIFLAVPLSAQQKSIAKFRGVDIPLDLKHGETQIEKGKYDLDVLIQEMTTGQHLFFLNIERKRKSLCRLEGELQGYETDFIPTLMDDPDIPEKPTLKMKRNPRYNLLYIVFESGKKETMIPLIKIRFKIEYEE
jgi:hypothetical protein